MRSAVQDTIATPLRNMDASMGQLRKDQRALSTDVTALRAIVKPKAGTKGVVKAANDKVLAPETLDIFANDFHARDFEFYLRSSHTRKPHLLPMAALVHVSCVTEEFGENPEAKDFFVPFGDALTRAIIPVKKKERDERGGVVQERSFLDKAHWDSANHSKFKELAVADDETLSLLWGICRDGREAHITNMILQLSLEAFGMRKEADGEAVLRQQEEIDDLRSGMRSALPGVGYGTCGAFGWNPRNKVMLGEDAEVMVAYQMFKRSMENIAEKYEMEFQDSLYTLGLHLVVFHYKFKVVENRTGVFGDTAGYGVMPEVSKWPVRIRAMTHWLLDEDQCPTENQFILEERVRLDAIAAAAEANGMPA